jgi:hypothetical protein
MATPPATGGYPTGHASPRARATWGAGRRAREGGSDGTDVRPEFLDFCASPVASRRGANKPGTLAEKRQVLNTYILPELGDRRIDDVDARTIDRFATKLGARLRPNTVGNIMIVLRRVLVVAKRWGFIRTSCGTRSRRCSSCAARRSKPCRISGPRLAADDDAVLAPIARRPARRGAVRLLESPRHPGGTPKEKTRSTGR